MKRTLLAALALSVCVALFSAEEAADPPPLPRTSISFGTTEGDEGISLLCSLNEARQVFSYLRTRYTPERLRSTGVAEIRFCVASIPLTPDRKNLFILTFFEEKCFGMTRLWPLPEKESPSLDGLIALHYPTLLEMEHHEQDRSTARIPIRVWRDENTLISCSIRKGRRFGIHTRDLGGWARWNAALTAYREAQAAD